MANGIFSQKVWRVKPYVGLGIGVARHSGKFGKQSVEVGGKDFIYDGASEDKFAFAYQAMAGVAYPLSDAVDARLGYRYFATSTADFDGLKATYGTHNFEVGIRFRF